MWKAIRVFGCFAAVCLCGINPIARCQPQAPGQWPFAGADLANTRSSAHEKALSPRTISRLSKKWDFKTGADVSATPTIAGNFVYVPDWGGRLYKLQAATGKVIWSRKVSEYTGVATAVSRTSPAISGNTLVIGTQDGGHILAINAETGNLIWKIQADPNIYAVITGSPVIHKNTVYVGVSSTEEGVQARVPGYVPSFRGSILALDLETGAIRWRIYTIPAGYTGGAVWGSTPVIDEKRNSLYIATGNNYTVPMSVQECVDQARAHTASDPVQRAAAEETCLAPDDYIDSVMAFDLTTGVLKWANRVQGADTWTVACLPAGGVNACPDPESPDYDFGSGPNLFTAHDGGTPVELVGAGQKSGIYWAFDPDDGHVVWAAPVGPGGTLGGIEWGSATDGERVYLAIANNAHKPYQLGGRSGPTHNAGSWAALDAASGRVLWQVKVPGQDPLHPAFGAMGLGAVSVANGLVFAGSTSGEMVVLDAATGRTLKSFPTTGSVVCGPSISRGTVFWGSGYAHLDIGTTNTTGPQLFAFSIE